MNNNILIKDPSNKFYAGMKLAEAKRNGTDKSFWSRDFSNIDTDMNGVLSVDEIMNERKKMAKRSRNTGIALSAIAVADMFMPQSRFGKFFDVLIDAAIAFTSFNQMRNVNIKTLEYEQILKNQNLNVNA